MKFSDSVVMFDYAKFPILGNLATGAVIGLDSAEERVCRDAFEAGSKELSTDDFSPEFCSALSEGKFFREEHDGNLSRSAYLHVTQRCNLNCVGCYSVNSKRNASPDLPLADVEEKIDNSPFSTLDVESISGCSNCGMKYLCGGGCRARSLYAYGDVRSCDPYCALAKKFYGLLGDLLRRFYA